MLSNQGAASRLWMILKSTEKLPHPHLSELTFCLMPNLVSTLFVPLTIFNIVCVLSHFLPVSSNSSGPASSEEFGAAEKHELGIYPACCFISLP